MRIAFIVNTFPKLSETFILNQATGLMDRGHEVDIFALQPSDEFQSHPRVKQYGLLTRTHSLSNPDAVRGGWAGRTLLGAALAASDLRKNPGAVLRSLNPFRFGRLAVSWRLFYSMRAFLGMGPYDVVHAHFGPLGNLAIRLRETGAILGKVVTTFRGYDVSSYLAGDRKHVYDRLFRDGDLLLCVSQQIRDLLVGMGCPPEKIRVHRSGVDLSQFEYVPRRSSGPVRLLSVARLVEKKGIEYAIRAVAKAALKRRNLEYRIAGDGPLRDALQTLIRELGAAQNIQILGWQGEDEIARHLRESHLLLAPSVTALDGDAEGVPGAVVQALAMGVPVISTRHGGIPEIIEDGESGFLVPERDSDALADRLDLLLNDTDLGVRMSQRGRRYVEENYDLDRLNDRLEESYKRLFSLQPSSQPIFS